MRSAGQALRYRE